MTYSQRIMKDRKAVCRLRYNVRKFLEAAKRSCSEDDYKLIAGQADRLFGVVDLVRDFQDDGTPIPMCTCIELPNKHCEYCGH